MAGRPLAAACLAALDEHEEVIFERLSGGEFVTDLVAELLAEPYAEADKGEPNTYHLYNWLDAEEGRRERFDRVREAAAHAVAEDSVRILDELAEKGVSSTAEATLAKARSHSRQWWAARLNRAVYGEGKQEVNVNVDIGQLHLDALRQAGSMRRVEEDEPEAIEAEYEIEGEPEPSREQFAGEQLGDRPGED